MIYFIRILLILLIIFLIVRPFIMSASQASSGIKDTDDKGKDNTGRRKGVPKSLGEYIDFEEVDKES